MKHTPGPWSLECDNSLVMCGEVVGTAPAPDSASKEEILANARLISASPDLLSALEGAYRAIDSLHALIADGETPNFDIALSDISHDIECAINKARGEE